MLEPLNMKLRWMCIENLIQNRYFISNSANNVVNAVKVGGV
jgi:hypothetical protein